MWSAVIKGGESFLYVEVSNVGIEISLEVDWSIEEGAETRQDMECWGLQKPRDWILQSLGG